MCKYCTDQYASREMNVDEHDVENVSVYIRLDLQILAKKLILLHVIAYLCSIVEF